MTNIRVFFQTNIRTIKAMVPPLMLYWAGRMVYMPDNRLP